LKLYKAKFPNNEVIKSKAETLVTENEAFNASPLRKDWVELFLSRDSDVENYREISMGENWVGLVDESKMKGV